VSEHLEEEDKVSTRKEKKKKERATKEKKGSRESAIPSQSAVVPGSLQ
jgi:hypothetical protein